MPGVTSVYVHRAAKSWSYLSSGLLWLVCTGECSVDGSQLICRRAATLSSGGLAEIRDGCYTGRCLSAEECAGERCRPGNNVRQMMAVIPVHAWMTAVGRAPNASAPIPKCATVTVGP